MSRGAAGVSPPQYADSSCVRPDGSFAIPGQPFTRSGRHVRILRTLQESKLLSALENLTMQIVELAKA